MLKKSLLVGLVVAACAIALAVDAVLMGARGQGAARSEDHREGMFRFHVTKLTTTPPRFGGDFVIEIRGRDARRVSITMRHLRGLQVGGPNHDVCEFGGPAVLRVATPTGVEAIEGLLNVRVQDNHERDGEGRDTLRLEFHRPNANFQYAFAGPVLRGDIDVFVRSRD